MKNKMVLAFLLITSLIFQTICVAYADEEKGTEVTVKYEANCVRKAEALKALGLIDTLSYDTIWDSVDISRAEYLDIVSKMMGCKDESTADITLDYSDVYPGYTYYNVIVFAYSNNLIDKTSDTVEPDLTLTSNYAVNTMLNAMKYNYLPDNANAKMKVKKNFLKDIKVSNEDKLTLNQAYKLVYNALDQDIVEQTKFSTKSDQYVISNGVTLISKYLDIIYIEGKETSSYLATIIGERSTRDYVIIDGNKYHITDNYMSTFVGYDVKGFVIDNESTDKDILWMDKTGDTEEIVFDASDFHEYTSRYISYVTQSGAIEKQTINNPVIIYNEQDIHDDQFAMNLFNMSEGSITLIFNNNVCEAIKLASYKNLVVGAIDTENQTVYDKVITGRKLTFDEFDKSEVFEIDDENGMALSFEKIKKNSIITYLESLDGTYIKAIVAGSNLAGNISEIISDGGKTSSVVVDGKKYGVSNEIENSQIVLNLKNKYVMYFNCFDHLAQIEFSDEIDGTLGYLVKAGTGNGLSDKVEFLILGLNAFELDDAVKYVGADKISVDGKSGLKGEGVIDALEKFSVTTEMPVIFDTNDNGEIYKIDTPYYDSLKESADSLRWRYNSANGTLRAKSHEFWGWKDVFAGKYFISYNGIILMKPTNGDDMFITDYAVGDKDYSVDIYGVGTQTPICNFAVINDNSTTSIKYNDDLAIVKKVVTSYNTRDQETVKLLLNVGNKDVVYYMDPDSVSLADGISYGDIIKIAPNARGDLVGIDLVFDYSNKEDSIGYQDSLWSQNASVRASVGKLYSVVTDKSSSKSDNKIITYYFDPKDAIDGPRESTFIRTGYAYSYKCVRDSITVEALNVDDLKTYEEVGNDADIVLVIMHYSIPVGIYFIR